MNSAMRFSRRRCRLLCTWLGSTSPWITFRMEMYFPRRMGVDTIMFFTWRGGERGGHAGVRVASPRLPRGQPLKREAFRVVPMA
jgi:hypothetical protein